MDLVQCSTSADCTGNFTTMTMRQCCVENGDGLSFTVNSTCHTCIGKLKCMLFCNILLTRDSIVCTGSYIVIIVPQIQYLVGFKSHSVELNKARPTPFRLATEKEEKQQHRI